MNNIDIGKRIREIRKKRCLTQEAVAEKLGLSPSYISDIERGVKMPSMPTFIELLKILDASSDYILQGVLNSGKEYIYNDINRKLDKLSPNKRAFISDFIDRYIESLK